MLATAIPESESSLFNTLRRHFRVVVAADRLVLRRREAASKDAPMRTDVAESWTMLRDAAPARGSSA
jgi:hypothetical protein